MSEFSKRKINFNKEPLSREISWILSASLKFTVEHTNLKFLTYSVRTGNHKPTVCPKHISFLMEHQGNELSPRTGVVGSSAQMTYGANSYQGNAMTMTSSQVPIGSTVSAQTADLSPSPAPMAQQHLAYQQLHQQQLQQLQTFWANQFENLDHITDFKNHSLPLARIKKIMKADEDVRMISAEAPVVFARACELFILELTLRSWNHTEENKRRTLQRNDIAAAITMTDIFDFLIDIVPREDLKDEVLASMSTGPVPVGAPVEGLPYYYMPPPPAPPVGARGMTVGQPVDPSLYGQHPRPYMAQHMWPQEQALPPTD